ARIAGNDFSAGSVSAVGDPTAVILMSYNWWGSPDADAAEARIAHHFDSPTRPWVEYEPVLKRAPVPGMEFLDVAIGPTDIVLLAGEDDVTVRATVHNAGTVDVQDVAVRLRDLDTGAVIGSETVPAIGWFDNEQVTVHWPGAVEGSRLEVMLDPWDAIEEITNDNNTAVAVFGGGEDPSVFEVKARWDGDGDAFTFGRFVSGVELANRFTATVIDPDGARNVDRVTFELGPLGSITDDALRGGWKAEYDLGLLTGDTTLTVTAHDAQGNASEPWTGTVRVVPFPAWLGTPGEDDTFENGHYHLNTFYPEQLHLTHTVPSSWWVVGGKKSEFKLGLEMGVVAGLDTQRDVPIDHAFVFKLKLLGIEVFGYEADPFAFRVHQNVTVSFSGLAEGEYLTPAGLTGTLTVSDLSLLPGRFSIPEASYPVVVAGIPFTVAVGMDVDFAINAQLKVGWNTDTGSLQVLKGTYLEPVISAEPYVFGGIGVPKFNAGIRLGGELGLHYRLAYDSIDGLEDYAYGSFQINISLVATAIRRYTIGTLVIGPWTFGDVPPGSAAALGATGASDPPDVWAWPDVAADASGNVLLARVIDADEDPGEMDAEIAWALRDAEGTWSPPAAITADDRIDCDPAAAFDGDGGAVIVWVHNNIDPAVVDSTDYGVYLAAQEIYSSYWDGDSWSAPQAVTSDGVMDAQPEVAFLNGEGLLVWHRARTADSLDGDGLEIYYAAWDDQTHTWGAPASITADLRGDFSPGVAFAPDGEAAVVWVHDEDDDPATTRLRQARWNGSAWSVPASVPIPTLAGVREPRIASDSQGNMLLAWVANTGGGDILYTLTWDDTAGKWRNCSIVPDTPGLIDGLAIAAGADDHALLVWHGLDGQDDVFATVRGLTESDPWRPAGRITEDDAVEWMASAAF
ncbi:MAG: CARDB domain-containing protein, partial [Planctomycetota bacterium]